jgi:hypothetical protein
MHQPGDLTVVTHEDKNHRLKKVDGSQLRELLRRSASSPYAEDANPELRQIAEDMETIHQHATGEPLWGSDKSLSPSEWSLA